MSNNTSSEESIYFSPVEQIYQGSAITCLPDLDIVEMTRIVRLTRHYRQLRGISSC